MMIKINSDYDYLGDFNAFGVVEDDGTQVTTFDESKFDDYIQEVAERVVDSLTDKELNETILYNNVEGYDSMWAISEYGLEQEKLYDDAVEALMAYIRGMYLHNK